MKSPVICFGQQPCGFFPKRFLMAKIITARRLQAEIGGRIVFFYHDSDHDPRETRTILRHLKTNEQALLNFSFENKLQRKFSPLYAKRLVNSWQEKTSGQLPNYLPHSLINIFKSVSAQNIADFCLELYGKMGILDGIEIVRSSSPEFRLAACQIPDYFVDLRYEGEIVRARFLDGKFMLHEGGDRYIELESESFSKEQVSPSRDSRLIWMQSVISCSHYICGASEQAYLDKTAAPEISFVTRIQMERPDEAYTELE